MGLARDTLGCIWIEGALAAKLKAGDGIEHIIEFFRVIIVEVGEDNGDDVVEITVGDDGDNGDMNLNTGSS